MRCALQAWRRADYCKRHPQARARSYSTSPSYTYHAALAAAALLGSSVWLEAACLAACWVAP
jgi:hypothetical protein